MSTEAQLDSMIATQPAWGSQCDEAMHYYEQLPDYGITCNELEVYCSMDSRSAGRVISNLQLADKIMVKYEGGEQVKRKLDRRPQTVYVVGPGREAYVAKQLASVARQAEELGYRLVPIGE